MTNHIFDATNALPTAGTNARLELALSGNAFIDLEVKSETVRGIQAAATQRILITTAGVVQGKLDAIELKGSGSGVYNEGKITSTDGAALLFSGGGTSSVTNVATGSTGGLITGATKGIEIKTSTSTTDKLDLFNSGTVSASGIAVLGGYGADRIVNTGTIRTTDAAAGAILLDLGNGGDFYDGTRGTAAGGSIKLGSGDDTAYGGSGDETFSGGIGYNMIDGGGGTDTIDYSEYGTITSGITINLGTSTSQWTGHYSDTLRNIENVIGTSRNDTLTGSSGGNRLVGGNGNDTLDGGFGNDKLEGGEGIDTAKYSGFSAVTVDLSRTDAQETGGSDKDTLIGIENLEGGSGSDKLTGSAEANKLVGNGNNDTLTGGGGNDSLEGGSGENTAVFSGSSAQYTINPIGDGFTITDSQAGRDGTDALKDVRFAKFADKTVALTNEKPTSISPSSATISESAAPGATVATLFGSDPDGDTITYSLISNAGGLFALSDGNKLVLAGALNYEAVKQYSLTVMASDGWGGEFSKTLTINVRNVTETTPLTLKGTTKADQLVGEAGNDKVYGLNGDDTLFGNAGNDRLYGGKGKDTYVGGAGKDLFILDARPTSKSIDWISDFSVKDDTIHLARKAFPKLKKGKLSKDAFVIGDRVKDAEDRVIYLKKAGALFYDADGTGSAKAVQFATIGKNLKLKHSDFFVI